MHIIVGYHQAPEGRAAFERAREEARLRDASLHAIHVLRSPLTGDATELRAWGAQVEQARAEASALERELSAEGLTCQVEVQTSSSRTPAEILIQAVTAADADLLIIGIRSRSPVGKLILGSVAREVLLAAPCPVLAVKQSTDDEAGTTGEAARQ